MGGDGKQFVSLLRGQYSEHGRVKAGRESKSRNRGDVARVPESGFRV